MDIMSEGNDANESPTAQDCKPSEDSSPTNPVAELSDSDVDKIALIKELFPGKG